MTLTQENDDEHDERLYVMDKVGMTLVNAALLAALPTALVAILVQGF